MAIVVLVVLLAILALTRQALRAPIGEVTALVDWTSKVGRSQAHLAPPVAATKEIEELTRAFDQLLTDTLVRERATSAHIAHELRTPLTALLADDTLPQAAREDLARLEEVIDAILVLSDTNAQRPSTLVNVADVVRALAPKETRVDAPDEALTAGDERLLSLAVRNLVDNARKHAGGPPVAMRVSRQKDFIRVSVVDEGPGATDEERARMFDRYWRGVADGTGRGLGLALVRAVAERHGGIAEARAAKKGLEAAFTLHGVERWSDPR
jgi:signal transduction histidine kinase